MKPTLSCCPLLCVVLLGVVSAEPLGTGITYQGVLTDAGAPVNGSVDLRFQLYDQATGGTSLGDSVVEDLAVVDGRVSVVIDFGIEWDGSARWLGVEVRDGASAGAFTPLPELQELLATPMGLYATSADTAVTADHATTASDAATLDGYNGDFYQAFGNLTGVPAGIADGDDDTAGSLSCAAGETPGWDGLVWSCVPDSALSYLRTAVVGPVGDGSDPSANGASLLAAIGALLPLPSSAEESWLVEVEPGHYELGASPLNLPPWTVVRGAGRASTRITGTLCGTNGGTKATVVLADHSGLQELSVENSCSSATGSGRAVSILPGTAGARMDRVDVTESGGLYCHGVLSQGDEVVLNRVVSDVPACDGDAAAIASRGANALIIDSEGTAEAFNHAYGLMLTDRAWVERGLFGGVGASGASSAGIFVSANADIRNVITGGVWAGAYLTDQIVTLSRVTNLGGVIETADQGGNLLLAIEHSRILGTGTTVIGDTDTAIGIAMSQVYGTVSPSGGLIACAGVWDGSWTPSASTCP